MSDLVLRETPSASTPRVKPPPKSGSGGIPVPFEYNPSDDSTDENILILLHGLGDTHVPFAKLGKQLNLPQTATLSLRAPEQIPFLYEQAFQWYTSFDPLGELIERPNPTPALDLLTKVVNHLTTDCQWPPQRIHMFGFSQGGTVVAEFGLQWWKSEWAKRTQSEKARDRNVKDGKDISDPEFTPRSLGTIVSVSGPLVSYPTLTQLCSTPLLLAHRPSPSPEALPSNALTSFKRGYSQFIEVKLNARGQGMLRGREEMEPVMRFWSERLSRRQVEGLYEVMSGTAPV
ncbi:hypothetical protein QCA50_018996 [Cerrena zonata]|uniref:Phospholipase/carboxylesterase/thioesterase domain-containing protein n=1 Tax=Cerrena zonata TaxID=2478898 RepID=A0AAW0FN25_9APHY